MSVTYRPGGIPVAVTRRGAVALSPDTPPALAVRIWTQIAHDGGFASVLEALTGAFGASLSSLPPFAFALAEGTSLRVAVRGPLALEVETASGRETISGAGVTTWTERVLEGVTRVILHTSTTVEDDEAAALPVADGVVLASSVEWAPVEEAEAPTDAPAPAREESAVIAAPAAEASPEPVADETAAEPAEDLPATEDPAQGATGAGAAAPEHPTSAPAPEPPRGPWSAYAAAPPMPPLPADVAPAGPVIDAVPLGDSIVETLLPPDSTIAPAVEAPPPDAVEATTGYDHLWGATVVRSVEDAAVREEEAEEHDAPAAPSPLDEGDHDGETISLAQARAMRGSVGDSAPPPLAPPRPPAPGRIRLSTGQVLLLDRTVVIGRRPRATRVTGTDLPHLVAVDSPQQDISRSHVELRVEGDSIVATDLRTTNGTTLLRPGSDPVRLHPGEPTIVVPGDVIDLGDGVTVTVEELT